MLARPLAVALFLGHMARPSGALAVQTFPALVPSISPHPHHTNHVDWGVVLPHPFALQSASCSNTYCIAHGTLPEQQVGSSYSASSDYHDYRLHNHTSALRRIPTIGDRRCGVDVIEGTIQCMWLHHQDSFVGPSDGGRAEVASAPFSPSSSPATPVFVTPDLCEDMFFVDDDKVGQHEFGGTTGVYSGCEWGASDGSISNVVAGSLVSTSSPEWEDRFDLQDPAWDALARSAEYLFHGVTRMCQTMSQLASGSLSHPFSRVEHCFCSEFWQRASSLSPCGHFDTFGYFTVVGGTTLWSGEGGTSEYVYGTQILAVTPCTSEPCHVFPSSSHCSHDVSTLPLGHGLSDDMLRSAGNARDHEREASDELERLTGGKAAPTFFGAAGAAAGVHFHYDLMFSDFSGWMSRTCTRFAEFFLPVISDLPYWRALYSDTGHFDLILAAFYITQRKSRSLTQRGACFLVLNAFRGIGSMGPIFMVSLIFSHSCQMLNLPLRLLLFAIRLIEVTLVGLSVPLEAVLAFSIHHLWDALVLPVTAVGYVVPMVFEASPYLAAVLLLAFLPGAVASNSCMCLDPTCLGGQDCNFYTVCHPCESEATHHWITQTGSIINYVGAIVVVVGVWLRFAPGGAMSVVTLFVVTLPVVESVTCRFCHDQLEGCTGGEDCPLSKTTKENLAALAVGAVASASLVATKLFPREYLQILTRSVLDTVKAVAKRALPGNVPDIRGWDIAKLSTAFKEGTHPRDEILLELATLVPGATAEEKATLKLLIDVFRATMTAQSAGNGGSSSSNVLSRRASDHVGVLLFLWALAGRIVQRETLSVSVFAEREETDLSVVARLTEKRSLSTSCEAFSERISVFIAVCHGLGVENVLTMNRFFREVVYDAMNRDKQPWQLAHMLVEVYLEDIDYSTTLNIGNIFASGGLDSRMNRARDMTEEKFGQGIFRSKRVIKTTFDDGNPATGGKKYNGKDTPDSTLGACVSYNYGNEHPAKSLKADGTCKYKHACMQWVTGKGPDGCCEGKHPRGDKKGSKCTNPAKTNDKERQ